MSKFKLLTLVYAISVASGCSLKSEFSKLLGSSSIGFSVVAPPVTNNSTVTIDGDCDSSLLIDVILTGNFPGSGMTVVCDPSNTYTTSITVTDPSTTVTATQGPNSDATNITYDTTPPVVTLTSHPDGGNYTENTNQTLSGNCETGLTVNLDVGGSNYSTACTGGTYSQNVTFPGAGPLAITFSQTDAAGNPGSGTHNFTLTPFVPPPGPTVAITSLESEVVIASPFTISISFSEGVTGFTSSDFTVTNATVTSISGGPQNFTAQITPTAWGNIDITIPNGSVTGNVSGSANSDSNTFSIFYANGTMVTTWQIDDASVSVPLPAGGNGGIQMFKVDWGDGSPIANVTSAGDPDATHTYAAAGTYTITLRGMLQSWRTIWPYTNCRIIRVDNLGNMGWTNFAGAFDSCPMLTTVSGGDLSQVTDVSRMFGFSGNAIPDTSGWDVSQVVDMNGLFLYAASANPDTSNWDTSNVTNMDGVFWGASVATPDVSNWNTSNVTNMNGLFFFASSANPDVSNWDTSNVTNMSAMFFYATSANPDVSNFDTSNVRYMRQVFGYASNANPDVSNWNTSNVEYMEDMFVGNTIANPDTSSWDTSKVITMARMFYGAWAANPNISGWDTSSVTNFTGLPGLILMFLIGV